MDIEYLGNHREVIPVLAGWIYDEWSYLYPGISLQSVEDSFRERTNRTCLPLTLVAFDNKTPVGTVSLKSFEMETRTDLVTWITSLYVAESRRRQGVGSRLLRTAEDKAASLGITKLYLFTTEPLLAELFYAKLHWLVEERTLYHSCPVVIMKRSLSGAD